ncbi:cell division protein FtsQ/DivIB [Streptococcus pneumoniae]|uniref:cell division protein FtsQ/DivIB n=1 Tax=Streptococcus pneumoniae TaxID=1313 RepID=UPI000DBE0555|nr:FtsQ-type POTRA domain-containing protein [Streptococcus pneumoniae]
MSKDKKNEDKETLEELKELSEWQKRNQEYLKKKAEEEAALAEEKEKERQARMGEESEKSEDKQDQESETDQEDSESAKEESEEKVASSEADKEKEEKEEPESKEKEEQDKKLSKKATKEKPAKAKIPGIHILRAFTILFPSLLLLIVSAYLLSPYATMKDIRVEGTVQTTADDIRQASGIQDSDYTINLLLDKAKYEKQIKSNYWVESAQLVYQFPTKFTIKVKEYDIVAYYISGENHYPMSEPSVVDMEAGIYSYTVADKLIMEAEEKAKQEAKEAEKKQEEEQKKQEEESN